jgi:hypothetical protein
MTEGELIPDIASEIIGSLLPGVGPVALRVANLVTAEWRRNSSTALKAAEDASGLSREDFLDWIRTEPRAVPLYLKLLWAAGTNGHDQTLKAMGAALGEAARATARNDNDGFEDAELALRAMAELTPRHFRSLAALADSQVVVGADGLENYTQFVPSVVVDGTGLRLDVANQCLLNLAGAGLVTSVSVWDGTAYPVTELGRAVIRAANLVQHRVSPQSVPEDAQ